MDPWPATGGKKQRRRRSSASSRRWVEKKEANDMREEHAGLLRLFFLNQVEYRETHRRAAAGVSLDSPPAVPSWFFPWILCSNLSTKEIQSALLSFPYLTDAPVTEVGPEEKINVPADTEAPAEDVDDVIELPHVPIKALDKLQGKSFGRASACIVGRN